MPASNSVGNLQATFASPDAAPTIRSCKRQSNRSPQWPPGQNADDRPLILAEEVGLPLCTKRASVCRPVFVIFAGFGCPSLCMSHLHSGTSTANWLKKKVRARPVAGGCVLRENLVKQWAAHNSKHRRWQKCMKANNLPHGLEVLRGLPQSRKPASSPIPQMCMVFRSPNTKDALSSLKKDLAPVHFPVCREGEKAERLPHEGRPSPPEDFTSDN